MPSYHSVIIIYNKWISANPDEGRVRFMIINLLELWFFYWLMT